MGGGGGRDFSEGRAMANHGSNMASVNRKLTPRWLKMAGAGSRRHRARKDNLRRLQVGPTLANMPPSDAPCASRLVRTYTH
eukprot:6037570-Pyramimonas_sp.AAC.1